MTGETENTRKDEKTTDKSDNSEKTPPELQTRDKITRTPPSSQNKSVSKKNTRQGHSKTLSQEGKRKSHVSRPVEKLKSAADRKSSGSQSQKRARSDSTDSVENPPEDLVSDTPMDDNENSNLLCPECKKPFHKNDSCVYCECCARWFHAKCHNISEEQVTAFKLLADLAHYYCPNCKAGASELHKAAVDMRIRVETIEKQVESLNQDNDATKKDVKSLQTQQKTDSTSIKTLKTVHETLRMEVDTVKTQVKTLKENEKQITENYKAIKSDQTSNTLKLNAVTTRLDSMAENIANIQSTSNNVLSLDDDATKDSLIKQIDERIAVKVPVNEAVAPLPTSILENEQIKLAIRKEVKTIVEEIQNEHFPYLPSTNMEVDESTNNSNPAPKVNPTFSSAVMNVMAENEEIRRRKLQIVITNVPENQNPDDDLKDAKEVFTLMGVNVPIVEAIRVGKKKTERPRVIRVTLQNPTDKRTLLAKATSLRNVPSSHKLANVYVKPNLTHQQQEQSKNLWRQLKEVRLKNPTQKYKISQGKIVEINQTN